MLGEPDVDEASDGARGAPRAGGGSKVVFEFAQVRIKPVGDRGFEQAAEAFDRIEFRAVGRQGQEPEVGGQTRVVAGQVKTGLVLDDDVQRLRIGGGDLPEEEGVDVPVDHRGEEQLGAARRPSSR